MLFVFTVSFFLRSFGFGEVKVNARNKVEALTLAAATEAGWMLADPDVSIYSIERGFLASCSHWNATGNGSEYSEDKPLTKWECEDCDVTWGVGADHPLPSATKHGFRAYCENLAVR